MRKLLLLLVCLISPAIAQTIPEGIGQGYDGELKHVTSQLLALAEATPTDKFAWRPSPGVRSTSEVYMHIAIANFYFLSVVGKQTMPTEIKPGFEKSVTAKADVISWLKRSLDAARDARARETPKEPSDLWDLEHYLSERRKDINRKYDTRGSRLKDVMGRLLYENRISEDNLRGLGDEKMKAIRSFAQFLRDDVA